MPTDSLSPRELLSAEPFMLFGLGPYRRKLLYRTGALLDACTGETLRRWQAREASIQPDALRVTLQTDGGTVVLEENANDVRLREGGDETVLTASPVVLPRFEGHPYAATLRALHAEVLVNIMPFGPVPNLLAYPRPWYRDSAMMLMVLKATGNLGLVEAWAEGLHHVYDHNNAGEAEADNLGQLLYMVSLFESGPRHPIVEKVLKAAKAFERGGPDGRHLCGRSDFAEHPVYQTKWMKFGLRSLGLEDPFRIPPVADGYSSLFWWDYTDQHVDTPRLDPALGNRYPYLAWAEAHFYHDPPPMWALGASAPLTWEAAASQAEYWRMGIVDARFVSQRLAASHTWHAAEAFLYLMELTPC